jgi:hypothetical protein
MIAYLLEIAGSIMFLMSLTGIGLVVGRWLCDSGDGDSPRASIAWAFLLGSATVGLAMQIPLAIDGRISYRTFAVVGITGVAAFAWSIARWWRDGAKISLGWFGDLPMVGRWLALVAIVAGFVYCCRSDLTGYDARSIYALKARILFDTGTIRSEDFQDAERLHFNPNYPLLLPLVEAQYYWTQGSYTALGLKLLFFAFPLALASIFAGELCSRHTPCAVGLACDASVRPMFGSQVGRGTAAMLALMLLLTPVCLECFEGAALSGSADMPLAVLLLAGILEISRWIRWPGLRPAIGAALLLGAAAATKAEGMSWIAACLLGMVGVWLVRRARPMRIRLATAAIGFGVLLLLVGLRRAITRQLPVSPYYLSYSGALSWNWIRQLGDRPIVVIQYAATELARVKFWNLLWPCLLGSLVLLRRGRVPTVVWFWRITLVAGIGASLFALMITPYHLQYELRTSMTRLMLQGFPLAALILAEQMAASSWIGQLAETMRVERTSREADAPQRSLDDIARAT